MQKSGSGLPKQSVLEPPTKGGAVKKVAKKVAKAVKKGAKKMMY